MAVTYDFNWAQGEDKILSMVYKSGPVGSADVVDLGNHKLRMDIVAADNRVLVVTNDESIADTDPYTAGPQADSSYEVTMTGAGLIKIELSRVLTLPGGPLYKYLIANPPIRVFSYDIFLRDAFAKQKKIMQGTITIERSVTHWL
jgi:hypothetical protein